MVARVFLKSTISCSGLISVSQRPRRTEGLNRVLSVHLHKQTGLPSQRLNARTPLRDTNILCFSLDGVPMGDDSKIGIEK